MDKIRLLTNGGYLGEDLKPGDILTVTNWEGTDCNAYVPSYKDSLYFCDDEFEKVVEVEELEVEGLFILLYDDSRLSGPYSYHESLEEFYRAVRSGNTPKICKLSFLD